jgi:uncharacterized membrane protein YbhN (UPF0104 family)
MPLDRLKGYGARRALRAVSVLAVAVGLWLTLRGVSVSELGGAIARTDLAFVAVWTLPLLGVGTVLRTARFGALLPGGAWGSGFKQLWSGVVVSAAANNVLPLRAGELVRTHETVGAGIGVRRVAFAQLTEKVLEATTLVVWATPALAGYAGARQTVLVACGVVGFALVALTALVRRVRPDLLHALAASAAWSFVADAVEIAIVAACLHGLGLPAGFGPSVTVFAAVNLAIALPSTPGNLGAMEAGAALPLVAMGVERDAAVAFAVVYRVVQWLPITLLGAVVVLARRARPATAAS